MSVSWKRTCLFSSIDVTLMQLIIQVAQRHGLFSATEGQILDMTLFETIPDNDMRWKAWSKVESTKRYAAIPAHIAHH